jgi:TRAP-type transport system small permease protein
VRRPPLTPNRPADRGDWVGKQMQNTTRIGWVGTLITIAFGLMIAALMLQVVARYVLQVSIPWTEEVSRYLLVLMTFVGAALALRDRQHIAITFLLDRLPTTQRIWADLLFNVLIMLFLGAAFRGSLQMIQLTWETPAGTVPWITTGRIYLILPFSIVLMLGYLLAQVYRGACQLSAQICRGEK